MTNPAGASLGQLCSPVAVAGGGSPQNCLGQRGDAEPWLGWLPLRCWPGACFGFSRCKTRELVFLLPHKLGIWALFL